MAIRFNIINYISGLTSYVFDKAVLERIALDRGVDEVTDYEELDDEQKELLRADLLYAAYLSPNVWASQSNTHDGFSRSTGSQTIYMEEKERLYRAFMSIYRRYDPQKIEEIEQSQGVLQWL
jgi:hypothetical protein